MLRNLLGAMMLMGLCLGGIAALEGRSSETNVDAPLTKQTARAIEPAAQQAREIPSRRRQAPARARQRDNRPAEANYEIYYFGSEQCGYCAQWMAGAYADWRRDPARRVARVHLAPEVETFAVNRGVRGENFGRYHRVYERAFRNRRFAFPAFVLTSNDAIVDVGTGGGSWNRMASKVRREAEIRRQLQ